VGSPDAPGDAAEGSDSPGLEAVERLPAAVEAAQRRELQKIERQRAELTQLCETVSAIVEKLDELHRETVSRNRSDIAKLAVEIARKIVMHEINRGDYDIQTIVEEALKRAPSRQEITVRVNPEDLPQCQQLQQAHPDSSLAYLDFAADWSVARADCVIETPKGVVKSFVEEHLERIGEALAKVT
jgi:flagellar biosynthesis/type III secretory pathway protein FliH